VSRIHIKRNHKLGVADARTQVTEIAESLRKELNADYRWAGNRLHFQRTGASGTIDVGEDYIELDIKLGMALGLLKGKIESAINSKLDAAVGGASGTKTA
jgi:putative polyhydroxyalkanoate system protein